MNRLFPPMPLSWRRLCSRIRHLLTNSSVYKNPTTILLQNSTIQSFVRQSHSVRLVTIAEQRSVSFIHVNCRATAKVQLSLSVIYWSIHPNFVLMHFFFRDRLKSFNSLIHVQLRTTRSCITVPQRHLRSPDRTRDKRDCDKLRDKKYK